jgi:hypothetical protein
VEERGELAGRTGDLGGQHAAAVHRADLHAKIRPSTVALPGPASDPIGVIPGGGTGRS